MYKYTYMHMYNNLKDSYVHVGLRLRHVHIPVYPYVFSVWYKRSPYMWYPHHRWNLSGALSLLLARCVPGRPRFGEIHAVSVSLTPSCLAHAWQCSDTWIPVIVHLCHCYFCSRSIYVVTDDLQDVWAYRAVGIPISRIFTVNHRGELKLELMHVFQSS